MKAKPTTPKAVAKASSSGAMSCPEEMEARKIFSTSFSTCLRGFGTINTPCLKDGTQIGFDMTLCMCLLQETEDRLLWSSKRSCRARSIQFDLRRFFQSSRLRMKQLGSSVAHLSMLNLAGHHLAHYQAALTDLLT